MMTESSGNKLLGNEKCKCGSISRNECGYSQEWIKYLGCKLSQNTYLQTIKRIMLEQNLLQVTIHDQSYRKRLD